MRKVLLMIAIMTAVLFIASTSFADVAIPIPGGNTNTIQRPR